MEPKSLLDWLLSGVNAASFAAAFLIGAIEYFYGAFLMRIPEQRARGYTLMYNAVEGFIIGMMFMTGIAALTPAMLAGYEFPSPAEAAAKLRVALDRFIQWLMDIAELERDLSLFPLFSPMASTVASSAILGRVSVQVLIGLSAGMATVAEMLATLAPVLFCTGLALACTSRTRRLGVYLAISTLAACITIGAVAPEVEEVAKNLKFKYGDNPAQTIVDYVWKGIFQQALEQIIEDGKLLATCLIVISVALGIAATAAAAASAAAGGFADSIISRIRL